MNGPEGKREKYEMKLKRVVQSRCAPLAFWPDSFCSATCWPHEQRGEAFEQHVRLIEKVHQNKEHAAYEWVHEWKP